MIRRWSASAPTWHRGPVSHEPLQPKPQDARTHTPASPDLAFGAVSSAPPSPAGAPGPTRQPPPPRLRFVAAASPATMTKNSTNRFHKRRASGSGSTSRAKSSSADAALLEPVRKSDTLSSLPSRSPDCRRAPGDSGMVFCSQSDRNGLGIAPGPDLDGVLLVQWRIRDGQARLILSLVGEQHLFARIFF